MNTHRINWKWATILLALIVILVACGGEDPTPTPEE